RRLEMLREDDAIERAPRKRRQRAIEVALRRERDGVARPDLPLARTEHLVEPSTWNPGIREPAFVVPGRPRLADERTPGFHISFQRIRDSAGQHDRITQINRRVVRRAAREHLVRMYEIHLD